MDGSGTNHSRAAQVLRTRRDRQAIAHGGLPHGYHGAAGPLLAGLGVDLGRLREAVAAESSWVQR